MKNSSAKKETDGQDLVQLILEDHKPLKQLIKIMKDSDKYNVLERAAAFEEFAPLLVTHAKPEEETLYTTMKKEEDLREGAFEGDVEHMLADQMIEEIKRTEKDEDLWSAKVKVLAELVEHHIEEEEEDMLPDFKKEIDAETRLSLGAKYLELKDKYESMGGDEAPPEKTIKENEQDQLRH